jgi:hypothetical protein
MFANASDLVLLEGLDLCSCDSLMLFLEFAKPWLLPFLVLVELLVLLFILLDFGVQLGRVEAQYL